MYLRIHVPFLFLLFGAYFYVSLLYNPYGVKMEDTAQNSSRIKTWCVTLPCLLLQLNPLDCSTSRFCCLFLTVMVGFQVTRQSCSVCAAQLPLLRPVLQQMVSMRVRTRERTTANLTLDLSAVPSLTWVRTMTLCGTCFSLVSRIVSVYEIVDVQALRWESGWTKH